MTTLGIGSYEAIVVDNRDGDRFVADLTPFLIRGQWDRVLDNSAPAQVTVAASPDCCDLLCKFTVVRHDLVILRDGEVAHQGPITRRRFMRNSNSMRISSQDVVWWLKNRVVPTDQTFSGDLGVYIVNLIRDAMAPDPRNWPQFITVIDGITDGVRNQEALTQTVFNELRELARTVLDYTTVGKRLIIGPDLYTLGELFSLNDEDFTDGIEVLEDGEDYRNVTYARHTRTKSVRSGEADPYYGLVEGIVREFSLDDELSAQTAADIDAAQGAYPPVLLFGEGGAILAPTAPVSVRQLVPGVIAEIFLNEVCPAVAQQQRLLRVECNFSNDDGELDEQIGTRWGPLGFTANRRQDL